MPMPKSLVIVVGLGVAGHETDVVEEHCVWLNYCFYPKPKVNVCVRGEEEVAGLVIV